MKKEINSCYKTTYDSILGELTLISDGKNLLSLQIKGQKLSKSILFLDLIVEDNLPVFIKTKDWLQDYFMGNNPSIKAIPLKLIGNTFRKSVWEELLKIPYGTCTTYKDIADKIVVKLNKERMSSQAVGNAVGNNPVGIIVPCHRVISKSDNLTGYAGGIDKKIQLLAHEKIDVTKLKMPIKK